MDWHLLGLSFVTVFLSELGDKSQLAAIALSGNEIVISFIIIVISFSQSITIR